MPVRRNLSETAAAAAAIEDEGGVGVAGHIAGRTRHIAGRICDTLGEKKKCPGAPRFNEVRGLPARLEPHQYAPAPKSEIETISLYELWFIAHPEAAGDVPTSPIADPPHIPILL